MERKEEVYEGQQEMEKVGGACRVTWVSLAPLQVQLSFFEPLLAAG
jgi:hypothetical protein